MKDSYTFVGKMQNILTLKWVYVRLFVRMVNVAIADILFMFVP
jgi:hypothetical protein